MMGELKWLIKPVFWLLLSLTLVWLAIFQLPNNQLHLVFCDVGQGDATLISYRSTQILIDGGPDNKVLDCLAENLPFWDRKIELVILSHPQADHLSGLVEVVKRYEVGQFVINSIINDSGGFWEFHRTVLAEGAEVYSPQAGDKLRLGPMQFLVLWPKEKLGEGRLWLRDADSLARVTPPPTQVESEILGAAAYAGDLNETSIVLKLSFGSFDALLTGDINLDIEEQIDWTEDSDRIEVLKVAHHGSKYSTGEDLLRKIQPLLAVISVGKNSFGHPTQEVLDRLSSQAIKFLRTDQEGEIEIVSDGQEWGIRK